MSEEINDGGPAFPLKGPLTSDCLGMSLRDYFAAKAMQALLSKHGGYADDESCPGYRPCLSENALDVDCLAEYAYSQADAMLAERERK